MKQTKYRDFYININKDKIHYTLNDTIKGKNSILVYTLSIYKDKCYLIDVNSNTYIYRFIRNKNGNILLYDDGKSIYRLNREVTLNDIINNPFIPVNYDY